jgi:hypothetical protein
MNRTYEGTVVNGQIRLQGDVELAENTRVYVVVPDTSVPSKGRVDTPRLAHPEQAKEFTMEVVDEVGDAGIQGVVAPISAKGVVT